ncbi:hypothetical protein Bca52824_023705 [Brassica carinata]|uniref:CRIB domain-containing protein n=1 Tax=Brassica carinata TaxID=52824 RepID=A0A8X7VJ75_BRACI|nr:hypothetical protein Bca52824_023705 [Brassica carinata]
MEKERGEIEIGYPTDVKHMAHIGLEGSSSSGPGWMSEFKVGAEALSPRASSFSNARPSSSFFSSSSTAMEKERGEIEIGYPTDVKHMAHIGLEGSSSSGPGWMSEFKVGAEALSPRASSFSNARPSSSFFSSSSTDFDLGSSRRTICDTPRDIPPTQNLQKWKRTRTTNSNLTAEHWHWDGKILQQINVTTAETSDPNELPNAAINYSRPENLDKSIRDGESKPGRRVRKGDKERAATV